MVYICQVGKWCGVLVVGVRLGVTFVAGIC